MGKCTVWYVTGNEYDILERSVEVMQSYDWVSHVSILHTDRHKPPVRFGELTEKFEKVFENYQDWGDRGPDARARYELKYVPAPEDGGWNETPCRNKALEWAEKHNDTWLLQCDTDEIFTYEVGRYLNEDKCDVVMFPFSTFIFMNAYKRYPASGYNGLRNPHFRIWKNGRNTRFSLPGHIPNYKNQTIHCWPRFTPQHRIHYTNQENVEHIHFHHLVSRKRDPGYDNNYPPHKVTLCDFQWPEILADYFHEQKTDKYYLTGEHSRV